jgi:hypothetical protein
MAIELLGLPGSGKSSLGNALVARYGDVVGAVRLRGTVGPLDVARGALRAALPFVSQCPRMPSRRWYRYTTMVHLEVHRDVLRLLSGRCTVAVLDQGPVYLLSVLQRAMREPHSGNARWFLRYWDRAVDQWARTLSLVVLLDGPADLLHERIQRRGSPHPLLGRSVQDARQHLDRSRRSRDRLLDLICSRAGGPAVLRIPSDLLDPDAAAVRVGECVGLEQGPLAADGRRSGSGPG